ncbi:alkylation response protein AidB-like acyl-CoA dehydrogenase [Anaerospora hongkongensis]|uniref:Alkylation response protein AidB-like acyl-CoA dehydrogenase n=1 Tax=Anaerospora hongkongensis TaxID=244830 RepID=A0A4R1PWS1_9FIRM|nr:acyl-CoA dehydrogenase [Anaerospora hongkongensis]TCL35447.1 alkylation response protein AidB-like acyl-CoA dehydrogenase [Anaerospora hongkongensis]
MALLTDDQQDLQKMVQEFVKKEIAPKAAHYDHTEEFPWDSIQKMAALGLLGIPIPEAYEGTELDTVSYMLTIEEISKACAATGAILAVHTSAGTMPILLFGTEAQKKKYIPPLATGEKVGAFALTEPGAGSDASRVTTTAVLDGDDYVLNGTKCFITNGGAAETYVVFASTDRTKGVKGITGFIVEKGTPGFVIGKKEEKMGIRASSTTELIFENCRIPKENLLGKIGEGFKIAMVVLDGARIGIGAQAVGIAQGAYEEALQYAKVREQFGKPIAAQQAVSFMLADMSIEIEAARQLVYHAAALKDAGRPYGKEAAMAKTFASDVAVKVALDAVQIMGGYGYSREYPVERMLRDAKITQIYEGTNQIQRVVIAGHILR